MEIGERLIAKAKLIRNSGSMGKRFWERLSFGDNPNQYQKVYFIGKRTIYDGTYVYEDGCFEQSKSIAVIMVVKNERTKPYYVLPEDIIETNINNKNI